MIRKMADLGWMDSPSEIFERFDQCLLPRDLAIRTRMGFAALAQANTLPADTCMQLRDMDDVLVFVGNGAIKLVAHASAQREQVIAFYFAEDVLTVPASGAHSYSLHALEHSDLLAFPYSQFLAQAREDGQILERLLNRHAVSLQRSREKTIALGRKTAAERLAGFLVAMAERIGRPDGSKVALKLPMTRRDIADSLGLTIETVSRQFSRMREMGLIETQGRSGVSLPSLSALQARSGQLEKAA